HLSAENSGGFLQSAQGYGFIVWIKQPVEGGAAGSHAARHFNFGKAFLLHSSFHLTGNDALDRSRAHFLVNTFLAQPTIKSRADVLFLQFPSPFLRLSARSISRSGVFCVFFIKPCKSTMQSCSTQKITRAIRPCRRLLRTSHNSRPSERTS